MRKILCFSMVLLICLAGQAAAEVKKVKFAFSWPPNTSYATMFLAKEKGYLQKEGLDVQYTTIGRTADTIRLVATGEQDFGFATPQILIISRGKGIRLASLAARWVTSPIGVASKSEKNIGKIEDLIGKTVGIPSYASVVYLGLRAMLLNAQIPESKVGIKVVGFRSPVALQKDQVDAIACFIPVEVLKLREVMGINVNVLKASDFTKVGGYVLYSRQKLLEDDPVLVEKFVRAINTARRYTIDHPDEALDAFLKHNPQAKKISRAELISSLKASNQFAENELTRKQGLGWQSPETWQSTHDFLLSTGLIKKSVDVKELFTNRFVRP